MAPHTERRLELLVLAEELTQQRVVAAMSVVARRIVGAADAQALRRHLWARLPDVIILAAEAELADVAALCRHIRQFFQTPILVLEDGASRHERIGWLDSGADDVLALRAHAELCARCFALLRRVQRQQRRDPAGLYLHALGFQLDIAGYRLYNPLGQPIDLNAEHTRLLAALFSYNGGIVPDEVLDRHMWDGAPPHAHSRLTGLVRRVNRRIAAVSSRPLYVERVRNNGYRLSLPTSGGPPL